MHILYVAEREKDDLVLRSWQVAHHLNGSGSLPFPFASFFFWFSFASLFTTQVVEALLDPDERGWVDRRSIFRFVKCMLPGVPDRALDGVVDSFMGTIQDGGEQGHHVHDSSSRSGIGSRRRSNNASIRSQVFVGEFLDRGDFFDRLTLNM